MYIFVVLLAVFIILVYIILKLPVFGQLPAGTRLERIRSLPIYAEGQLKNLWDTPMAPEGVSYWTMGRALLKGNPNKIPPIPLTSLRPNLNILSGTSVTWFGHSSYLIQADELKILVDPVFSKSTSPFSFIGNKNFEGTDFIQAKDFSTIDVLLITHDHYDHLDYQSILQLMPKVKHFITSVGVGSHLEKWGIPAAQITELAWYEETVVSGLKFTATPARHFTGRQFKRNQTLWSSFVLQTPQYKLFLGGDSGYEEHFKSIGEKYGPFELAILECGQYDAYWPYIHMFPEQTVQAAKDLQAKWLMPVHWGKFSLSLHDWNDPILRVTVAARAAAQQITTPLLGETVSLGSDYPQKEWWLNVAEVKQ